MRPNPLIATLTVMVLRSFTRFRRGLDAYARRRRRASAVMRSAYIGRPAARWAPKPVMPMKHAVGAEPMLPPRATQPRCRSAGRRRARWRARPRPGRRTVPRRQRHHGDLDAVLGQLLAGGAWRSTLPSRRRSAWRRAARRPRPARSRAGAAVPPASVRSAGSTSRDSTSRVGPSARRTASSQHSAASIASAGPHHDHVGHARAGWRGARRLGGSARPRRRRCCHGSARG